MAVLKKFKEFWRRQPKNWKVIIARNSLGTLFTGRGGPMVQEGATGGGQYWSIFMSRIGLSTVEIGLLRSISSAVNMLLAIPSGWLTDRTKKMKRLYLSGRVAALPVALLRYLTYTWPFCILVSIWEPFSMRFIMPPSQIIRIDSLSNEDRITGLSINRTIMGVAGIIGPMLAAYIINYFGGLDTADGIRPLFLIQFGVSLFLMILLFTQMQEVTFKRKTQSVGILSHLFTVFKEIPLLKLLLLTQSIMRFGMSIGMPFMTLYMVDIKSANEFILGWRGTVQTALTVVLSIPIGTLADRMGRLKVAYIGRLFSCIGLLFMILTPSTHPEYLIITGVLEAFRMIMFVGWQAFTHELIPLEGRGRFSGVSMLLNGMVGIIAPILGGLLWEINPNYIWWIRLIIDALLTVPLMIILGYKSRKTS
ncbi:MFS transporter [Candidatus Bathyarchaeota archaeon]|nr:MFS transporter [Candidatus Bathyarchaeota archaeon]